MLNQINNKNFPVIRCIGIGKTYSKTTDAVKNIFKYNYEEQKNETGI